MTSRQQLAESNDGVLLSLVHFACSEHGWDLGYVLDDISMISLLLLVRAKATAEGKSLLSLQAKEEIESTPWEELVKRSRERVAKQMAQLK